jgi:hypothetical protein
MASNYPTTVHQDVRQISIGDDFLFPVDLDGRGIVSPEGIREISDRLSQLGHALLTCVRYVQRKMESDELADESPKVCEAIGHAMEGIEFIGEFAQAMRAEADDATRRKSERPVLKSA